MSPEVIALRGAGSAPVLSWSTRVVEVTGDDLETRVASVVAGLDGPAHLVATGNDGVIAVRVALLRPDLVRGLVLADSGPDGAYGDVTADLPRVPAPALVVAARPDPATDLSAAQTLAGQIPNGVFVVVDGVPAPVHEHRPASFTAWASSFLAIVDGLVALDTDT
ncbi:MAG: hypothetical protein J7518_03825 [Nocardioidaceae bacterium]|nr:hypothetical protein [Nocardioidaceae bacterium]